MKWNRPSPGKILIALSGGLLLCALILGMTGSPAIAGSSPLSLAPTATAVSTELVTQAEAAEQVFINIYQRMDPAVVNIEISNQESGDVVASGSGFVIDTNGDIVTNNHVVDGAKSITVTFYDGYTAPAKIVGTDAYSDLAVIKVTVSSDHLTPLTLGDSSALQVGQRVIAIGNPFGLTNSMTTGVISATGRTQTSANQQFRNPSIIQTDAAIN
ncbi:MAG TPA: trypsin-like peptidase domain-containing protein, partial [Aggregatilineales bacterium]|nr:trypsin-like peptidase domain-containing protein [Aggregatilineales bacterium]